MSKNVFEPDLETLERGAEAIRARMNQSYLVNPTPGAEVGKEKTYRALIDNWAAVAGVPSDPRSTEFYFDAIFSMPGSNAGGGFDDGTIFFEGP